MGKLNPIEVLIRGEEWLSARREIERVLEERPSDHWLHTRLGLTYYEMRDYSTALKHTQNAQRLDPKCPLVLWDLAGTLQMLDRHEEALEIYRTLTRRGPKRIANGRCGEGLARARGLIADCHYRMSESLEALGKKAEALQEFEEHLELRGPGCESIYPMRELHRLGERVSNRRKVGRQ